MSREAVVRVSLIECDHPAVAGHLGDDRGCRDRGDAGVAFDDHLGWTGQAQIIASIAEHDIGQPFKLVQRPSEAEPKRLRKPKLVEFASVNPTDCALSRLSLNLGSETFPLFRGQLLAVA